MKNLKTIRCKAPLRIGLAGGGTDVSPFSDLYGGCVLNTTINLYAHCSLELLPEGEPIVFRCLDLGETLEAAPKAQIDLTGKIDIHTAVYNRVIKDFNGGKPISCRITTWVDAPPGSGLGSSSTLVVAILGAFCEFLNLPLGEYDIAHLAFEIERKDLNLDGGKQDQYAATFGGFNFMEFEANDRAIVNPLRIKKWIKSELEESIVLVHTGRSRDSARIIKDQRDFSSKPDTKASDAMHLVKKHTQQMKNFLLKGELSEFANVMGLLWDAKKNTSSKITNPEIDSLYVYAKANGAISGKISGAGGGGFMMLLVDPLDRLKLIKALTENQGEVVPFSFVEEGVSSWRVS